METALNSSSIPPEILQALLNLAEFMEHDDKPLPINIKTLGGLAEKCAAYAKALHYKEIEFQSSAATTCEALISINNQLDLPEAAVGILVCLTLFSKFCLFCFCFCVIICFFYLLKAFPFFSFLYPLALCYDKS